MPSNREATPKGRGQPLSLQERAVAAPKSGPPPSQTRRHLASTYNCYLACPPAAPTEGHSRRSSRYHGPVTAVSPPLVASFSLPLARKQGTWCPPRPLLVVSARDTRVWSAQACRHRHVVVLCCSSGIPSQHRSGPGPGSKWQTASNEQGPIRTGVISGCSKPGAGMFCPSGCTPTSHQNFCPGLPCARGTQF